MIQVENPIKDQDISCVLQGRFVIYYSRRLTKEEVHEEKDYDEQHSRSQILCEYSSLSGTQNILMTPTKSWQTRRYIGCINNVYITEHWYSTGSDVCWNGIPHANHKKILARGILDNKVIIVTPTGLYSYNFKGEQLKTLHKNIESAIITDVICAKSDRYIVYNSDLDEKVELNNVSIVCCTKDYYVSKSNDTISLHYGDEKKITIPVEAKSFDCSVISSDLMIYTNNDTKKIYGITPSTTTELPYDSNFSVVVDSKLVQTAYSGGDFKTILLNRNCNPYWSIGGFRATGVNGNLIHGSNYVFDTSLCKIVFINDSTGEVCIIEHIEQIPYNQDDIAILANHMISVLPNLHANLIKLIASYV